MRLIFLGMHSGKIIFVWGFLGGFRMTKDGTGLGSKFKTLFFFSVVTDSFYHCKTQKKKSVANEMNFK